MLAGSGVTWVDQLCHPGTLVGTEVPGKHRVGDVDQNRVRPRAQSQRKQKVVGKSDPEGWEGVGGWSRPGGDTGRRGTRAQMTQSTRSLTAPITCRLSRLFRLF